ncbi:hypothetical protein PENTCL1PPCAC_14147, partial [Pristionchus entomophagus]
MVKISLLWHFLYYSSSVHRRHCFPKCLFEVVDEVLLVLYSNGESDEIVSDPLLFEFLRTTRSHRHHGGQAGERLRPAQRHGQREDLDRFEEPLCFFHPSLDVERDHAGHALRLPQMNGMLRVRGQRGVEHLFHPLVLLEELCDGQSVVVMGPHSKMERLDASVDEEAVEGPGDGTHNCLLEGEMVPDILPVRHHSAHDDVRVAVDV